MASILRQLIQEITEKAKPKPPSIHEDTVEGFKQRTEARKALFKAAPPEPVQNTEEKKETQEENKNE